MTDQLPAAIPPARVSRMLTAAEFQKLADVPPEVEWFANLMNAHTRRAYENAVKDFMRFAGIVRPEEFRTVTRAHVIAWRDDLRTRVTRRGEPWSDASIRHRLSALAALFEYLCDRNAVTHNPVKGVARPKSESGEGKTPAIGDHQARKLLTRPTETARSFFVRAAYRMRTTARATSATAPYFRRCFSTRCGVKNCASSRSRISGTRAKACRISACQAKAARRAICRCIPAPMRSFTSISTPPATAKITTAHCSGRSATTRPASSIRRSRRTASISWCVLIGRARVCDRRACAAGDSRHQRARSPGRYRQGAGVAWPRQHRHHADLRSPTNAAGGQPDVQGRLLTSCGAGKDDSKRILHNGPYATRLINPLSSSCQLEQRSCKLNWAGY